MKIMERAPYKIISYRPEYLQQIVGLHQYLWRGDMIGSINGNQGFDVLWKSKDIVKPVPFSPFIGKA